MMIITMPRSRSMDVMRYGVKDGLAIAVGEVMIRLMVMLKVKSESPEERKSGRMSPR